ncbi:MAG: DUF402 domain-containing protein [Candidatus Promineifilaceae bacterium]
MLVYKLNDKGQEVLQYPAKLLSRRSNSVRLEAFFSRQDMDLGFVWFKQRDRFIEYFYNDRWYNVFAVYDRDDALLKGWYCNICRPAQIMPEVVRWEDLALDLWVAANGETRVLDEDEFAILPLKAHERERCADALQHLQTLAQNKQLPT